MEKTRRLKFIIPSFIGVFLFITPIVIDKNLTVPIALISQSLLKYISPIATYLAFGVIVLPCIITAYLCLIKPKRIMDSPFIKDLFYPPFLWLVVRYIAMVFILLLVTNQGPEWLIGEKTGGVVLYSLIPILLTVFLLAGLLLPLLLNFGLLEFIGIYLSKIMRPIFGLPGRAAVDCITSWLGDGSIGILLTSKQYEQGFYTEKEAATIGTTFSAVSITFCLVVIETVGLGHLFIPFYLTVSLSGFVAAILLPRIPPLSRKNDIYHLGKPSKNTETISPGFSTLQWALKQATDKAEANFSWKKLLAEGIKNGMEMWIGVIPVVLTVGTVSLVIAEYTSIFQIIGYPFIPLLKLLRIPEATAASETMIIGFTDMFIPTVLAAGKITTPLTRFVVAALSVTQLIYMAEVGGLLLASKIPINLKELFILFLERTIITLPIIALMGHIIFS